MYLIEFIIKKLTQKKEQPTFNPLDAEGQQSKDYEGCEHVFMPIDSSGELLSCTKCGVLVRRDELKNKNFFRR